MGWYSSSGILFSLSGFDFRLTSEKLFYFSSILTINVNILKTATRICKHILTRFGLNFKVRFLGPSQQQLPNNWHSNNNTIIPEDNHNNNKTTLCVMAQWKQLSSTQFVIVPTLRMMKIKDFQRWLQNWKCCQHPEISK